MDIEGDEEDPAASLKAKKVSGGSYLISINSNIADELLSVIATKKGVKSISFKITTDGSGDVNFRTKRELNGFTITLRYKNEVLDKVRVK